MNPIAQPGGQHPFRGLHGQVVETLGQAIGARELVTGDRIVPEEVADTHAVSRAVVREALKVLEAKGMVAASPRIGTQVRAESEWDLLDPAVIRWRARGSAAAAQFNELLQVRGAIEPLAARLASEAVLADRLIALRDAVEAMSAATVEQNWHAFTEADVAFHRALLVASGNQVVAQLGEPIEAALRVRHALNLVPPVLTEGAVADHRAIVDAITNSDAALAELASRRIVDVAGAEIMASLMESGRAG